jgi:tRNA(fMet)-specific endonuclease VapC
VFALDANALIHALKGIGQVRRAIEGTRPADLAVPAVVAYELEVGTLRSRNPAARRRELNRLLTVLTVLPFDLQAADRAARVRFDLERYGSLLDSGCHKILYARPLFGATCGGGSSVT